MKKAEGRRQKAEGRRQKGKLLYKISTKMYLLTYTVNSSKLPTPPTPPKPLTLPTLPTPSVVGDV
ncbi:hypothetical protein [Okeania sp. SIO2B3]|uniref:hypothetical protein n=1 Tax=Okeania sp. SIO2B3 TaxID=2607784 RepID=UPI0013C0913D|nr:hypothetical protein [Okeania sp. SIO2B3]NET46909.1 hypothetical protein [Okeania sp. SIO2B3]